MRDATFLRFFFAHQAALDRVAVNFFDIGQAAIERIRD